MSIEATSRPSPEALSPLSRQLTRLVAVLFAVLGLILFLVPDWASANFLWKISPFVAMTMGGWYLGSGIVAFEVAREWRWSAVYASTAFLWMFSLLETTVLVVHNGLLRLDAAFGWPYLAILVVTVLVSAVQFVEWLRVRPSTKAEGEAVSSLLRFGAIIFTITVYIIAIFPILGYGRGGTIFPEKLSLFTLNAFGVFYFSIAASAMLLIGAKTQVPIAMYSRGGLGLLYPITLAALLNLDKFDFAAHPGGLIYIGVYVIVGVIVTGYLIQRQMKRPRMNEAASDMQSA